MGGREGRGELMSGKISQDATVAFKAGIYIPGVDTSLGVGFQNIKLLATSLQGGWANVLAYGAIGDGFADDTAAITAAITAMTTAGGVVYFPPGTYRCSPTAFTAISHATLLGAGPYASQITFTGSGVGWTFNNCQDLVLENLAFLGNQGTSLSGVNFAAGSGVCTVRQCQFTAFDTDGLQFTGTSLAPLSGHKVIDNIFVQNAGKQLHFLWSHDFCISAYQYGISSETPVPAFGCYLDNPSAGTYTQNYHWNNN